jgi:signal transduction histidine kinase
MRELKPHAHAMLRASSSAKGVGHTYAQYGFERARAASATVSACPEAASQHESIPSFGWTSASIAHDLRNPLATIFAGLEILTSPDLAPSRVKRVVTNMSRAARRMGQLLTDLQDAALGNAGRVEICEIGQIIAAAWDAASTAAGGAVQFELHNPELTHLPLVRSRIERVFFNLFANACEAMPRGGKILSTVSTTGSCVVVSVEDNGPGIPESIRQRLFEPYATSGKNGGVGLGLAFARHAVRDHGGDLWIDPAAGARFLIRLPLAAAVVQR